MPARHESGHGDRAAHAAVEPRARPDLTPRVARDQLLEVLRERRLPCLGPVDVLVTEDRAPELHALLVAVGVAHASRCSRTPASNASGCATFAMCAAPSIST